MEQTYLPGTIRDRIQDLMKSRKITQAELAVRIGTTESTLSRFLSGKTDKLGDESIIRIAHLFNVSTDFLLGVTNIPDQKNYDIDELGLSAQAARNLYTGKADARVVNRLLENNNFLKVTTLIAQFLNDELAAGIAAQNQLFSTVSAFLAHSPEAAKTVSGLKVPTYQADLTMIQNTFMTAVKEIKKEVGSDVAGAQELAKLNAERMFAELTQGQDKSHPTITPEQLANAVSGSIDGLDNVDADKLNDFTRSFQALIHSMTDNHGSDTNDQ